MARFRKITVSLLLAAALVIQLCTAALATRAVEQVTLHYRGIRITLNGTQIVPTDTNGKAVDPFIIDGTTYLPIRAVAGALGLEVGWSPATSTVTLKRGGKISYGEGATVGGSGAKTTPLVYRDIRLVIDGETITPTDATGKAAEPFIIDGTTYLPVRAVAGALGLTVDWDDASSTVILVAPTPAEPRFLLTKETEESRTGDGFATKTYKAMKTYLYDDSGNRTEMTVYSPDGTVIARYGYDKKGQLIRESSTEKNRVITYAYDEAGQLLNKKQTDDEGTAEFAYTYDSANRTTRYSATYTGPDGKLLDDSVTTTYRYDAVGRLLETSSVWRQRTAGELLEYDTVGNIIKRTKWENNTTEIWFLSYDKKGNLLTERCIDGKKQFSHSYDADGNRISTVYTHDGIIDTTVFTYKDGRMVKRVFAGSDGAAENHEWTYSPEGTLLSEAHSSSKEVSYTVTHVRSDDGRQLRSVTTYDNGRTKTDTTTYDEYGNVVAREISAPGLWEHYTYEYAKQ